MLCNHSSSDFQTLRLPAVSIPETDPGWAIKVKNYRSRLEAPESRWENRIWIWQVGRSKVLKKDPQRKDKIEKMISQAENRYWNFIITIEKKQDSIQILELQINDVSFEASTSLLPSVTTRPLSSIFTPPFPRKTLSRNLTTSCKSNSILMISLQQAKPTCSNH